jgi:hypothetical protein
MKAEIRFMKCLVFLQRLIVIFAAIYLLTSSANAQCVPDTLNVTSVAGKVIAKFNDGEAPLNNVVVMLIRGGNDGPTIAKQAVSGNESFSFKVKPGKYQLKVSVPHLSDFYLNLRVKRSKTLKDQKEIIVIMSADFRKECSGSFAELRVKKNH